MHSANTFDRLATATALGLLGATIAAFVLFLPGPALTEDNACSFCSKGRSQPSLQALAERVRVMDVHNYREICATEFPDCDTIRRTYANGSLKYITLLRHNDEFAGEIWFTPEGELMSIVIPWADAFYAPLFDREGRLRAVRLYDASGIAVGPSPQIEPPLEILESQIQWYDGGASQERGHTKTDDAPSD